MQICIPSLFHAFLTTTTSHYRGILLPHIVFLVFSSLELSNFLMAPSGTSVRFVLKYHLFGDAFLRITLSKLSPTLHHALSSQSNLFDFEAYNYLTFYHIIHLFTYYICLVSLLE